MCFLWLGVFFCLVYWEGTFWEVLPTLTTKPPFTLQITSFFYSKCLHDQFQLSPNIFMTHFLYLIICSWHFTSQCIHDLFLLPQCVHDLFFFFLPHSDVFIATQNLLITRRFHLHRKCAPVCIMMCSWLLSIYASQIVLLLQYLFPYNVFLIFEGDLKIFILSGNIALSLLCHCFFLLCLSKLILFMLLVMLTPPI